MVEEGVITAGGGTDPDGVAAVRGDWAGEPLTPRRVAGLLDAPGCARRRALDAAGVPLDRLAGLLGCPPGGQSPFAHARTRTFTSVCTADDLAALAALATERLGTPVSGVRRVELPVTGDLAARAELTRRELSAALDPPAADGGAPLCLVHNPVLGVTVAGRRAPLAVDPLVLVGGAAPHPLEIRTFPCVDGVADPAQVAQAARQLAVSVLALRESVTERVAARGLLVMPENFSLRPTASVLDVAPQVRRLSRLLAEPVDAAAPPSVATGDPAAAAAAVRALRSRFGDGCPACPLFAFCRAEHDAAGAVERVGTDAANLCGGVGTVEDALALAAGDRTPSGAGEQAVAAGLGRAARALELVGAEA